jgi:hypothetical protein
VKEEATEDGTEDSTEDGNGESAEAMATHRAGRLLRARQAKAAAEKLRDEKLAHAKQAATIAKNVVAMEALRDAQVRGMAMARLSLTKAQDMISKLEDELAELDDEEADLRRTLAGGGLSASEEEAVRRRLNEIEQENIRIRLTAATKASSVGVGVLLTEVSQFSAYAL